MTNVKILRAFTDAEGKFGSSAGVVVDEGRRIDDVGRLAIARQLGYEETAFVNEVKSANISIFDLQKESKFAGVPIVCVAWLLGSLQGEPLSTIQCLGGPVQTWQREGLTWVRASLASMPPWIHVQYESAEAVERITPAEGAVMPHTMAWGWIDEAKGLIRARTFMSDWEIAEAEGNGSGAMMLADKLNCSIEVRHGEGSIMYARPSSGNFAEVGGRVVQDPDVQLI